MSLVEHPCPNCLIPVEIPQPAPEKLRCPHCGTAIKPAGATAPAARRVAPGPAARDPRHEKTILGPPPAPARQRPPAPRPPADDFPPAAAPAPPRRRWGVVLLLVVAAGLAAAVPTALLLLHPKGPDEKHPADTAGKQLQRTEPTIPDAPGAADNLVAQVGVHDDTDVNCTGLLFTPDGLVGMSKCAGGHVYLWDLKARQQLFRLDVPGPLNRAPGAFAISPDGKHVVISPIGLVPPIGTMLGMVDAESARRDRNQKPLPEALVKSTLEGLMSWSCAAFSPSSADSSLLAVAEYGSREHGSVHLVPLAPLGAKPAGKAENKPVAPVRLADVATHTLPPFGAPVFSLAFSPDGSSLLAGGNKDVADLWGLKDAALLRRFKGHEGIITQVGFSNDADWPRVFTASGLDESLVSRLPPPPPKTDGTLRVWDNSAAAGPLVEKESLKIEVGKEQTDAEPRKPASPMTCAAFRGTRALTGHKDGSVALWDLTTGKVLKWFDHKAIRDTKETQVAAVAISPDGYHALAAIHDGSVSLYRLPAPPRR